MGGQSPIPTTGLYPAHLYPPPESSLQLWSSRWELLVEAVTLPLPPLVHLGPHLWLRHRHHRSRTAASSHWRALYDIYSLLILQHAQPSYLSEADVVESMCYGKTHIAFSSFTCKRPYQWGWMADITYGEGIGQRVPAWAVMALKCSGPSRATLMFRHVASPLSLCSSPEQQGTDGGFSLKPEVNYALLDNFQLPVLAIKEISSRWHAYLCAGREAPPACFPRRTPAMYFQGADNLCQCLTPS